MMGVPSKLSVTRKANALAKAMPPPMPPPATEEFFFFATFPERKKNCVKRTKRSGYAKFPIG
jgi:hypothetical protein